MSKFIDLTGQKFGRWTVIKYSHKNSKRMVYWLCKCDCGNEKIVLGNNLRRGKSLSCGCLARELNSQNHQLGKDKDRTKIYYAWSNLKRRCYDEKNFNYQNYGARGIVVCNKWKNNFQEFYDWSIKNGYAKNLTLDRIDVNGNYEPSNCRWITLLEQANNKRNNYYVKYENKMYTIADLSRKLNMNYDKLKHRIRKYGSI